MSYWQFLLHLKGCLSRKEKIMRLIDADELSIKIIEEMKDAVEWGITAIADGEKEFRLKAEQAVESFCEALLLVKEMPTIDPVKRE